MLTAGLLLSLTAAAFTVETETPDTVPVAQNFHRWGSITLFNGLPSDSVRAIAQTPDGVLWLGTDNGLARFDGRRVQNFLLGEADSNRVLSLKTSPNGELWIGTQRGAFVYADNRLQGVPGTEGKAIRAMQAGDAGDEILLGTDDGLLLRIRLSQNGVGTAEKLFPDALTDVGGKPLVITSLVKQDDKVLIGSAGRGTLVESDGTISELQTSPRPLFVNALIKDTDGNLWLGTDAKKAMSGIYHNKTVSHADRIDAPTANVLALGADESGIWAGTARYGLFHVVNNKVTETFTLENSSGGLRSNTIYAVFADREGVVWVGTNRGVSRYDPQGAFQQTVSDIPNSNFIRTFFRSGDGRALFAGSNRGLFEFDGENWKPVSGFDGKVVYAVQPIADGIAVGTPTGTFDSKGKLIVNGDTRAIEMFRGKTYAAVYGRGVIDITGDFQQVILPDETATSLLSTQNGLWIGTAGHGLFRFDGKQVVPEAGPDKLQSGTIRKIFEAANRGIWIAAEHGVFALNGGRVEQAIAAEDVRDVFVSGSEVWAATATRGLLHARKDERFGWLVSEIGFEQGMPSEKAFAILPEKGSLLIATNRGVVRYIPHDISPKLIPVRVLSQKLHDLTELRSTLALDYPQNSLLVEVAGQSSRTFPEEFQYAFILRNSRGEILASRISKEAQYTPDNLSAGEYSIEAIAINRDLRLSEPLFVRFSIGKAPFPLTASALGFLLVLALVGLVWAAVEHRRIRQRNRELAAARLDLANEAERERRRIARDLHDQTLADLRNLMMMSDEISPGNSKFRDEVEAVSGEIRRICEDLSPSVLENVGLVAALEFLLGRTIDNNKFAADDGIEDRIAVPLNVQLQIYRIAQEVLTNIKRHSNADFVEMTVAISGGAELRLTIGDNGRAFQPDVSTRKGRGIINIKTRASLINARTEWTEQRDGGNNFVLKINGAIEGRE